MPHLEDLEEQDHVPLSPWISLTIMRKINDKRSSSPYHSLWYDVVNSSDNMELTIASMSDGWGFPVQL